MQAWVATEGNLVYTTGDFTQVGDETITSISITDGWGDIKQRASLTAMLPVGPRDETTFLISLDDDHVFGPYVVTSYDRRGEPGLGSDGVMYQSVTFNGSVWPHIDWLVLDSAAEVRYYNQISSGVLAIGAVEPFRTWISGLTGDPTISPAAAAAAFRDRVMSELLDSGTLDEMNTVLRQWHLLIRPTTSVGLLPELVVLPRYPLNIRRYRSDELYAPRRLPSPLPDTLTALQRGNARTTLVDLGVVHGDYPVSVPDFTNAPGTYSTRQIKSAVLNFTNQGLNQLGTDVTLAIRGDLLPPVYLPQLQTGDLFTIREGQTRQELEWSSQTVSVFREGFEFINPRNQFVLDGETYAVSQVVHTFDGEQGFHQQITGTLVQDPVKRLPAQA